MSTSAVGFNCPWCGMLHLELVYDGAETEMICGGGIGDKIFNQADKGCKKPIRIVTDNRGNLKFIGRASDADRSERASQNAKQPSNIRTNSPSISIGNVYGPVAFGGNATTITNIYNEAVKAIDDAKNVNPQQKTEAKGALAYFKTYAPTVLPIAADIIKKTLGL